MKSYLILSIVSLLFLCSCSGVKQSYSPNGKPSYEIKCNNAAASLNGCYQKAGEICKSKGYSVISTNREAPFVSIIAECKE